MNSITEFGLLGPLLVRRGEVTLPVAPGKQAARALSVFRAVGDRWGEADTLTNLGDIRRAAGELPAAWEAWQQALVILDDLEHPYAAKVRAKLASTDNQAATRQTTTRR